MIYFTNSCVQFARSTSSTPSAKRIFYSNVMGTPDLCHWQPRPPHRIYSIDDRVHRTRSTPPLTMPTALDLVHRRSCPQHMINITDSLVRRAQNAHPLSRTPRPRRPHHSVVGTLARFLAIMLLLLLDITYMLVFYAINLLIASYMTIDFCLCIWY
jgi:hypothetical protein